MSGRWLGRDPIEEEGGVSLTGFVYNSPTGWIDDTGLAPAKTKPSNKPPPSAPPQKPKTPAPNKAAEKKAADAAKKAAEKKKTEEKREKQAEDAFDEGRKKAGEKDESVPLPGQVPECDKHADIGKIHTERTLNEGTYDNELQETEPSVWDNTANNKDRFRICTYSWRCICRIRDGAPSYEWYNISGPTDCSKWYEEVVDIPDEVFKLPGDAKPVPSPSPAPAPPNPPVPPAPSTPSTPSPPKT